jgi:hypothetical protein
MDNRTEQLLEGYFANTLTEGEAKELRDLLDKDPEAAAEWRWQQQIAAAVGQAEWQRPALQAPQPTAAAPKPALRLKLWLPLAAAAALAAWVVAKQFMAPQPGALPADPARYAAHFEHYANRMPFRALGAPQEVPKAVLDAFQLYDAAETDPTRYPEAAAAIGKVAAEFPDEPAYQFYHGMALLGAKDHRAALQPLQAVSAAPNSSYRTPARYFLGIAHAAQGDYPAARAALQGYLDDPAGVPYKAKAQALLHDLPQ